MRPSSMEESDLLDKLIHGKITSDEADDLCSAVLSDTSQTTPAHEILGLSFVLTTQPA
ncbi:protein of unknown function (plasmid) [Cupriavidus taiwanensis]|uniref:Uncharacterized protein n=2 Tax=Cupriavidus taiwanensis TaxID=164546 RepID=A0A7Z7NNQ7_9BURK|nr:protein of unknown function [Cupriavidus taiwanensis]SOZ11984.1 protein of unknown function [Cupriavidus taiwanensis]SOZ43342.1 protein of unknown function [Cupriavidus taiwanensis]SPC22585.1 protein of unknown function [Cupriavidus taiwanensis]SPD54095.1 protein of unknown function [Cupriavidus taiwanensis]